MKENIILEQYKQAHNDRAKSADRQWQLISYGNALLGGLVVAAITSKNLETSLFLSGIAIPVCLLIFIAYRKYVYFENLAGETIEAIEEYVDGVLHVQYDTVPQKKHSLYYIVRYPKPFRPEQISMHTVMNLLFVMYNILALGLFAYFAKGIINIKILVPIIIIILPALYLFAFIMNVVDRGKRSFKLANNQIQPTQKSRG